MAEQRPCVACGETIPEQRAKRVACVTCSKACEKDHRRATTSRAARAKRKRRKQPRNVLLKVDGHVASTIKQAAQAAGVSQTAWAGLIVEALLEEDQTARGWALQQHLASAEPVARGTDSIHVRLSVLRATKVEERAAQDGQKLATWLRWACYWASHFADQWHRTGPTERLKLESAFKAHDHKAQARTVKEEAFRLRVDSQVASTFEQAAQAAGLSQTDWGRLIVETLLEDDQTARGWALQQHLASAEPVAQGTDSIHVRLPVFLGVKAAERAAQDGQKRATWLRWACYWASYFADQWHRTGTIERLKLGYEFLKAHDHEAQARTVKEKAFRLRRDALSWVIERLTEQTRGWPTVQEQELLNALNSELEQIKDGACAWEDLNASEVSSLSKGIQTELLVGFLARAHYRIEDVLKAGGQHRANLLAQHNVDTSPLSQIVASLTEKPRGK